MLQDPARLLIVIGLLIAAVGVVLLAAGHLGLGRLPGDIHIRRGNFSVYVPLATGLVLSVVATVVLNLVGRK
ncbi:MAG: DUF2905 domain-containing protein [Actinomycetota bacterium]|jgi:uncharacterized membrane protein YidH (DUF202 family)